MLLLNEDEEERELSRRKSFKLVKSKKTGESYALKSQGKKFIIDNGQKDYILRELELMNAVKHPNILMLHCAFQDPSYIYFLLDLLPGGELMTILESKKKLPEKWVQFYSASVILAYTEFHRNRIAYRDLKPENMVLDAQGYCVIVDLGLAKKLDNGPTYTFCGILLITLPPSSFLELATIGQ